MWPEHELGDGLSRKLPSQGFLASRISHALVLAYDVKANDAVWIRHGQRHDHVLDEDVEAVHQIPESLEDLASFCDRYGFERITTQEAEPYVKNYLQKVFYDLISPEVNGEIIKNPEMCIQFVRAVKNFMLDVEEIT